MREPFVLIAGVVMAVVLSVSGAATAAPGFNIVSEEGDEARRLVRVRVDERLQEADVRGIAETVRAGWKGSAKNGLVELYLPGMRIASVPWAVARVGAEVKVEISGLSADDERALLTEASFERRDVIGVWLMGPPAVSGRLMIVRERGKTFAEWRLANGRSTFDEVTESRWNKMRRFDIAGARDAQFYVVTAQGGIEVREGGNVIAAAERAKMPMPAAEVARAERGVGNQAAPVAVAPAEPVRLSMAVVEAMPAAVQIGARDARQDAGDAVGKAAQVEVQAPTGNQAPALVSTKVTSRAKAQTAEGSGDGRGQKGEKSAAGRRSAKKVVAVAKVAKAGRAKKPSPVAEAEASGGGVSVASRQNGRGSERKGAQHASNTRPLVWPGDSPRAAATAR